MTNDRNAPAPAPTGAGVPPDRERLRATFTEAAELYDRVRPGYPQRMFDDLSDLAGAGAGCRLLALPGRPSRKPPARAGQQHPSTRDGQRRFAASVRMIVRPAGEEDVPEFLALAAQVEHWFGPMVGDAAFHTAVAKRIRRGQALVAVSATGMDVLGGLLFGVKPPTYHVHWLVVSEQARGHGVGRALMADAMSRFVRGPGTVEVVTFGADHPGASTSGARAFYERLGYTPAEPAAPGPEGGSRQTYRKTVP